MKSNPFQLVIFLLGIVPSLTTTVTVNEEGGYKDILIAISKNVDEDMELIENLKELFTKASESLHIATKGAVYFEEITISLPSTWSHHPSYDRTVKDNFRGSDIKIDEAGRFNPFTEQNGGCGQPGQFIQLSPDYLRQIKNEQTLNHIPEKRLVSEWAKFRYGVFDESVKLETDGNKRYYKDNGDTLPTICSTEIGDMGHNVNRKGEPCDPESTPADCYFIIPKIYVTQKSSLMFSNFFPSIDTFCDDTPERKHNQKAPNEHNRLCNYRSTWDVIKSHKDFKIRKVPSGGFPIRNTTPKFRITRTILGGGRVVLVLDISGSMMINGGIPIKLLHRTARQHILENAPDGTELGIVLFGSHAKLVQGMEKLNSESRKRIADKVPSVANGGGTAIGKGLQAGVAALKDTGQLEGSVLLLITDGEENVKPWINETIDDIIEDRVIISVIAYGDKASNELEKMALSTGGKASVFRDIFNAEAKTSQLETMIMEATTVQADIDFEPVKLKDNAISLISPEFIDTVSLDPELGKNTVFRFSTSSNVDIAIELTDPSGSVFNWQSQEYSMAARVIKFQFPIAQSGIWTIKFSRPSDVNADVDFTLSSEPIDSKNQPVRVDPWIDLAGSGIPVKVSARVYKKHSAVIGVSVEAIITGPNDFIATYPLRDDGIGADTKKDNGVYSGYITNLNANGRYGISAQVLGGQKAKIKRIVKTKRLKRSVLDKFDPKLMVESVEDQEYTEVEVQDLSLKNLVRIQDVGTLLVTDYHPDLGDLVPPSRVVDLKVDHTLWREEHQNMTVDLTWTATGDDFDSGIASAVHLRVSDVFDNVLFNFNEQLKIDETFLVNGTLEALSNGSVQYVSLVVPVEIARSNRTTENEEFPLSRTLYFGVVYSDENNNSAPVSNIAAAYFVKLVKPTEPPVILTTIPEIQKGGEIGTIPQKNPTAPAAIAISVIISVVVIAALLSSVIYLVRSKYKYQLVSFME